MVEAKITKKKLDHAVDEQNNVHQKPDHTVVEAKITKKKLDHIVDEQKNVHQKPDDTVDQ